MAQQRGFRFYLWQMHGLSARAVIRGKRATKNIRKYGFPVVFFGLLGCTNRSFCAFPEVLFDLLPGTNRSFCVFSGVLFDLLRCTNRSFCAFPEVLFGLRPSTNRSFCVFSGVLFGLLPSPIQASDCFLRSYSAYCLAKIKDSSYFDFLHSD